MKSSRQLFFSLIICCSLIGCARDQKDGFIEKSTEGATVRININHVDNKNKSTHFVYGKLNISSPKKISSVDIDCFQLKYAGGGVSNSVYVDRVSHVLKREFPATNGVVNVPVYWIFNSDNIDNYEIDKFEVDVVVIPDKSCVIYS